MNCIASCVRGECGGFVASAVDGVAWSVVQSVLFRVTDASSDVLLLPPTTVPPPPPRLPLLVLRCCFLSSPAFAFEADWPSTIAATLFSWLLFCMSLLLSG